MEPQESPVAFVIEKIVPWMGVKSIAQRQDFALVASNVLTASSLSGRLCQTVELVSKSRTSHCAIVAFQSKKS